jgi:hypothetical protein
MSDLQALELLFAIACLHLPWMVRWQAQLTAPACVMKAATWCTHVHVRGTRLPLALQHACLLHFSHQPVGRQLHNAVPPREGCHWHTCGTPGCAPGWVLQDPCPDLPRPMSGRPPCDVRHPTCDIRSSPDKRPEGHVLEWQFKNAF